ncbi:hypothetical protein [Cognatilysobacter bugurensis]|uniref:hypothetical protein n=1 Tax=Cognatilysobacter bugurensis TaxID=543356 RepID=UPI001674A7E4|nr:hypothetical protein [Lysobacter bugurensis]
MNSIDGDTLNRSGQHRREDRDGAQDASAAHAGPETRRKVLVLWSAGRCCLQRSACECVTACSLARRAGAAAVAPRLRIVALQLLSSPVR